MRDLSQGAHGAATLSVVILTLGARVALGAGALVEGTVSADPTAPPKPAAVKVTKDVASCGAAYVSEAVAACPEGHLGNVVVSLRPAKVAAAPTPAPPPGHPVVDQQGCRYLPHVQATTVGSELTLINSDRVLHNVHGNNGPITVFNLAMPIKGQKLPTKLTRPGLVRLQCDAGHTWMNAWIYVFDQPYFAVTDAHGHFAIPDVPPGEYTIEYWHEPLDGKGGGITWTAHLVVGGKPARVDLRFKL